MTHVPMVGIVLVVLSYSAPASAQTMKEFIEGAVQHAQVVYQDIRSQITNSGRDELIAALNGVEFEIDSVTPVPNGFAQRFTNGHRKIVVSAQLVLTYY